MTAPAVLRTEFTAWPVFRGKVRDVYDLGETLLIVATDRISAFDWVLPTGIPDKGRILTQIAAFWFEKLAEPHHLISTSPEDLPRVAGYDPGLLVGRMMLVKKTKVAPIECVVRGYLAGSGWKEYRTDGTVCGLALPPGLQEASQLPTPIFTPAAKVHEGHDENITFAAMRGIVGDDAATELRSRSIAIYRQGAEFARGQGIIIADTKFEWGWDGGAWILVDEVLTPDSSRFWPQSEYRPGGSPPSFDKQYVRDWLETTPWDKASPPPELPPAVVEETRRKYVEAYERLTARKFD